MTAFRIITFYFQSRTQALVDLNMQDDATKKSSLHLQLSHHSRSRKIQTSLWQRPDNNKLGPSPLWFYPITISFCTLLLNLIKVPLKQFEKIRAINNIFIHFSYLTRSQEIKSCHKIRLTNYFIRAIWGTK